LIDDTQGPWGADLGRSLTVSTGIRDSAGCTHDERLVQHPVPTLVGCCLVVAALGNGLFVLVDFPWFAQIVNMSYCGSRV